jgi:CRP/FNR family cyclic AMP-dependent transcriptional regulator
MINYIWDNLFKSSDQDQMVLEALRNTFIFQSLTKKELRFVKETVHVRSFRVGESVFRQGELGIGMYIILQGSVEIYVNNMMEDAANSKGMMVTRLMRGDFLGELSLVENNGRRTATAMASEDSVLIGFFKPDLIDILERQPATGVKITLRLAEVLGRRLKETTTRVSELKTDIKRMVEKSP